MLSSLLLSTVFLAAAAAPSQADLTVPVPTGQVTISLAEYRELLEQTAQVPPIAPSGYAIGQADLSIEFEQIDGRISATVDATMEIETFVDEWALVPILAPGAALNSATIDGSSVQLIQAADGLYWLSESRQKVTLALRYHSDARSGAEAVVASIPTPRAAATHFSARLPFASVDLAVAPASHFRQSQDDGGTVATGTLPNTSSITVTWRAARGQRYALSRAEYNGEVNDEAVTWRLQVQADVFGTDRVAIPILPAEITLLELAVDGQAAPIYTVDEHFTVHLEGAGSHQIEAIFHSPLGDDEGIPNTRFNIPRVPVSRFNVRLPGQKLVRVEPHAAVTLEPRQADTVATFYTPLSDIVAFSWSEAVPADIAVEKRANASVYQALHAAEGVLYGQAAIAYEITRGQTNRLSFSLPVGTEVNRIDASASIIADWVQSEVENSGHYTYDVFLDRPVNDTFLIYVDYEQLINTDIQTITTPFLRANEVSRQQGMLALLTATELALAPQDHERLAEVGENQLPAFFHDTLKHMVSHTYKYHGNGAQLALQAVTPKRAQAKFNTQIDTLVSISEVTLKGQASIQNDVKSGSLREIELRLPPQLNLLSVNGPSIRAHQLKQDGKGQSLLITFTQDMQGQFQLEMSFEHIMAADSSDLLVPQIEVVGADVEHGRIAIEALTALEVQASRAEHLSSLEVNQLPKQLLLKTTNPILLAYKYVRGQQPLVLALRITRHQEIDLQVAAIDQASYQTLFTQDGLAVTRARFEVRNSRRQFLRLDLPQDANVWSVFVNGHAQKPAVATQTQGSSQNILVKMINSAEAFPVELVYARQGQAMGAIGTLISQLPRPDMIVTRSQWDVYVPSGPRYAEPDSNMEVIAAKQRRETHQINQVLDASTLSRFKHGDGLPINLPTQGKLFRFSKLFANQASGVARFSLSYVQHQARHIGLWLSLIAAAIIWAAIALLLKSPARAKLGSGLMIGCAVTWIIAIGWLKAPMIPPAIVALAGALVFAVAILWQRIAHYRKWRG